MVTLTHGADGHGGLDPASRSSSSERHQKATRKPLDRPAVCAVQGGAGDERHPLTRKGAVTSAKAAWVARALSLGMTQHGRRNAMCRLCDEGIPQSHYSARRDFLKAIDATGAV